MDDLQNRILEVGVENCMFIVPMKPVQTVFGLFAYTSSDDPDFDVPAVINEDRYPVEKGYKITLKSTYEKFGKQHFYLSDLEHMINDGRVKFFVQQKLD